MSVVYLWPVDAAWACSIFTTSVFVAWPVPMLFFLTLVTVCLEACKLRVVCEQESFVNLLWTQNYSLESAFVDCELDSHLLVIHTGRHYGPQDKRRTVLDDVEEP